MGNNTPTKQKFIVNRFLIISIIVFLIIVIVLALGWSIRVKPPKNISQQQPAENKDNLLLKGQTFLSLKDLPDDIKRLALLDESFKIINIWSYIDNNQNKTINIKAESPKSIFQLFESYIKFAINNKLALVENENFHKDTSIINLALFNIEKKEKINIVLYNDKLNKKSIINLVFSSYLKQ